MRTQFGKRLVASGLIAAIGANLVATGPAFAGPDGDKNYTRQDTRHDDGRRGQGPARHDDNRGPSRAPHAPAPQAQRGPSQDHRNGPSRAPVAHAERRAPAVRVVEKPVAIHRDVVRPRPAVRVVERPVAVHREVVHARPTVRADYHPSHGYYSPAPTRVIVVPERRRYRDVWVVRQYGHRYHGYGHFVHDHDAYPWLAFTAISVALITALTVDQQRAYEDAQIRATTAPIGQTIVWDDGNAAGSVVATRDGTSSAGRYCREFQQTVTIGGRTEQAYGTACQQPDGAWQIISQPNF